MPESLIQKKLLNFIARGAVFLFLAANIILHMFSLMQSSKAATFICVLCLAFCVAMFLKPKYLSYFLNIFGFSFAFFGAPPYSIYSQVFQFWVASFALTLFLITWKGNSWGAKNYHLLVLLFSYVALSVFSIFLLPLEYVANMFSLLGIKEIFSRTINEFPDHYLYSIAGINRLLIFSCLALQFLNLQDVQEKFFSFFKGVFGGAVFSAILGLGEFYNVFSLSWYRETISPGVVNAFFLNRGWFAQFILMVSPFILIGFWSKKTFWWRISLFALFIIFEIALILSGARAGWIAFPFVIVFCWIFGDWRRKENEEKISFRWKILMKSSAYMALTVLISFLIIVGVLPLLSEEERGRSLPSQPASGQRVESESSSDRALKIVQDRVMNIIEPHERINIWKNGVNVGRENLLLGMGYDSYRWQTRILDHVPDSFFKKGKGSLIDFFDTPHNTFIQFFVSGGIIGTFFWLLLVSYAVFILIRDLKMNQSLRNSAIIISLIVGHLHGIFQDLQYIPMIWCYVIMEVGYAATVKENILGRSWKHRWDILSGICLLLLTVGIFYYPINKSLESVKSRYGLKNYLIPEHKQFIGFYQAEKWENGNYRWSGSKGLIKVPENRCFEITFICLHPDIKENPVWITFMIGREEMGHLYFSEPGAQVKKFHFSKQAYERPELLIAASRTWNPYKFNVNRDNRNLGVAVSDLRMLDEHPMANMGFYQGEKLGKGEIPEWDPNGNREFRWSEKVGSLLIKDEWHNGAAFYMRCLHPDVKMKSVVVKIIGREKVIREEIFRDAKWKKVEIEAQLLKGERMIIFDVSRTWNPKFMGVSDDARDLGVGIAIPGPGPNM